MTVATLLATCLLFVAAGAPASRTRRWRSPPRRWCASPRATAARPRRTSRPATWSARRRARSSSRSSSACVTSALAIGWILIALDRAATTYVAADFPAFEASEARVAAARAARRSPSARSRTRFRGADWRVLLVREPADGVPVGRYLVGDDARIAFRVDPGVCGTEPEQRGPDGHIEKVVTKFDAPKAQLFRLIIDGVLGGRAAVGPRAARRRDRVGDRAVRRAVAAVRRRRLHSAADHGGDRARRRGAASSPRARARAAEAEASPGTLFASGLIAGGALAGLGDRAAPGARRARCRGPTGSCGRCRSSRTTASRSRRACSAKRRRAQWLRARYGRSCRSCCWRWLLGWVARRARAGAVTKGTAG